VEEQHVDRHPFQQPRGGRLIIHTVDLRVGVKATQVDAPLLLDVALFRVAALGSPRGQVHHVVADVEFLLGNTCRLSLSKLGTCLLFQKLETWPSTLFDGAPFIWIEANSMPKLEVRPIPC
jgi:hypothetical protein